MVSPRLRISSIKGLLRLGSSEVIFLFGMFRPCLRSLLGDRGEGGQVPPCRVAIPIPPKGSSLQCYVGCEFLLTFFYGVHYAVHVPLLCHVPLKTHQMSLIGRTPDP